jgi:hypothetical protein
MWPVGLGMMRWVLVSVRGDNGYRNCGSRFARWPTHAKSCMNGAPGELF